jgi:hypothetical protein
MRKALERLVQSAIHLEAIDGFFADNVPEYAQQEHQLQKLGRFYEEFARELYAGGRKEGRPDSGGRFHRGLILADLVTYTVFGRGFYVATASKEHRSVFTQIVLRIVNKLLIQENISTDPKLRRRLLKTVASLRLTNFFEDDEQKKKFDELKKFSGPIIWNEIGKEFYKSMDSHLPKSRGLAIEFLVYLYLIQRNFGFIIPLLLHQRLLTSVDKIAPPDFLVLKPDGRCFGVEVGFLKEGQSTEFVTRTSLPTVVAELDSDQPFRCPECRKWITYCDRVIEDYSKGISSPNPLSCSECKYFDEGKCQDIVFYGRAPGVSGQRRYHYQCVSKKVWVKKLKSRGGLSKHLKAWFPTASIIDSLSEKG